MESKKKNTIITTFAITLLMIALVSGTFAYFSAQGGGSTSRNVSVTSNTTDLLTFQVANDITFTASEANFYQGGNNVSGSTTASATLVPNNNTNQATMNYYMYLDLTSNPITYSSTNTNEDPELLLQVFDGSNQLVTLTGLGSQVTVGGLTGYNITGKEGIITLLDNHTITANGATEVENWRVVITLVNLAVDQNDNTNKTILGEIVLSKSALTPSGNTTNNDSESTYVYWNDNFSNIYYSLNQIPDDNTKDAPGGISYSSRVELATALDTAYANALAYTTFANSPIYIKSDEENESFNHEVCLWYNNDEFCIAPNYWAGDSQEDSDGLLTKAKLKADLENTFGITLYNDISTALAANSSNYCDSIWGYALCYVENFNFIAYSFGDVSIFSSADNMMCGVSNDGTAYCKQDS